MTDTIHPRFTLNFGKTVTEQYGGPAEVDRWLLDSTAPGWEQIISSRGNVNSPDQIDWAKEWAARKIAEMTSYEVTSWDGPGDEDPRQFWAPRLVHVSHAFKVCDTDGDAFDYTAKGRDDAEHVQESLLRGAAFIRLVNGHGVDTYLNCAHIVQTIYAPVRTEVPL